MAAGIGSMKVFLLLLLAALMAARVHPSPFIDYDNLPFPSNYRYPSHAYASNQPSNSLQAYPDQPSSSSLQASSSSGSRRWRHPAEGRKESPQASEYEDDSMMETLEYDFPQTLERQPQAYLRKPRVDSSKNLQQILRSFPLVVGGHVPPPSSSGPFDVWRGLGDATEDSPRGLRAGGTAEMGLGVPQARLTDLTFPDSRSKRVMCHFKICNLGRRRRARQSGPMQGWLS